jgi:hypothetical protein
MSYPSHKNYSANLKLFFFGAAACAFYFFFKSIEFAITCGNKEKED